MVRRVLLAACGAVLLMGLWGCVGFAVSPDGKRVVASWSKGLVIVDDRGRILRKIPRSDGAHDVLWSPNGKYVLFLKDVSNSKRQQHTQAASGKPHSTPTLHFSFEDNVIGVYLYDIEADQLTRIALDAEAATAFRSDSRKVAIVEKDEDGGLMLVERDVPSGEETARYNVSAEHVSMVQWLPGRDAQAYIGGGKSGAGLYVLQDGVESLVCPHNDVIGFAPTQDGKGLIWARAPKGGRPAPFILETYDLTARTCTPVPLRRMPPWLTASEGYVAKPEVAEFSPDTRRVVVSISYEERRHATWRTPRSYVACFVMTTDGTQWRLLRRTIPRTHTDTVIMPQWSRNGQRIGVMLVGRYTYTVSLFEADGSNERRVLASLLTPRHRARRHRSRR